MGMGIRGIVHLNIGTNNGPVAFDNPSGRVFIKSQELEKLLEFQTRPFKVKFRNMRWDAVRDSLQC